MFKKDEVMGKSLLQNVFKILIFAFCTRSSYAELVVSIEADQLQMFPYYKNMLKEIGNKANVELEVIEAPIERALWLFKKNKVDILANRLLLSVDSDSMSIFLEPELLETIFGLWQLKEGNRNVNIKNARIAGIRGSLLNDFYKSKYGIKISHSVNSYDQLELLLLAQRVDYILATDFAVKTFFQNNQFFELVKEYKNRSSINLVLNVNSLEFKSTLESALLEMKKEGKLNAKYYKLGKKTVSH